MGVSAWYLKAGALVTGAVMLAAACGAEEPAPTPAPVVPTATKAPAATAAPTGPTGTLNVGYSDLGPPRFIPDQLAFPQLEIYEQTPIIETPLAKAPDGSTEGRLLKDWKWAADGDGQLWTFNIRKGIKFHKGNGDLTAADFVWTIQRSAVEDSIFAGASRVRSIFLAEDAELTAPDANTLQLRTPKPQLDTLRVFTAPLADSLGIFSKKHFDAVGAEAMAKQGVGTGPWQLEEFKTGEFMRLSAVEDHYRKTPAFAELVIWEVPEEATRLANFLTGKLDTMHASLESLKTLKNMSVVKYMRESGGGQFFMVPGGQYYAKDRPGREAAPWISKDSDVTSAEWKRASKVRTAMAIAIDRKGLADDLLDGEATPLNHYGWMGLDSQLGDIANLKYEYDPKKAKELLAEAGYPSGFKPTFYLASPSAPGIDKAGEAVAAMLESVGVNTKYTNLPYATFRPNLFSREWDGLWMASFGFQPEPRLLWRWVMQSEAGFNIGVEHSNMDKAYGPMYSTADAGQRWKLQRDFSRWVFEDALVIPILSVNRTWPVGQRIATWDLMDLPSRHLSNLEFVTHR